MLYSYSLLSVFIAGQSAAALSGFFNNGSSTLIGTGTNPAQISTGFGTGAATHSSSKLFSSSLIINTTSFHGSSVGTTSASSSGLSSSFHNQKNSSTKSISPSSQSGGSSSQSRGSSTQPPSLSTPTISSSLIGASPSGTLSIPISTISSSSSGTPTSGTLSSSTSINPLDIEPFISTVTTVVSGTTQVIPMLFGGIFTTPVPISATGPITSIPATGTAASSSASVLSSKINVDLFPIISAWKTTPQKSQADDAVSAIKGILPSAEDLLDSLGGDPTPGGSDCRGKKKRGLPNPFKAVGDIIKDVSCIINTLNQATKDIENNLDTAVDDVEDDISALKSLTEDLEKEEEEENEESSSKKGSSSSASSSSASSASSSASSSSAVSSSSCTKTIVTQDVFVQCTSSVVSGAGSQVTEICTTSTLMITDSDCQPITAFTTTEFTAAACLIPTSAPVIGSIGTWSFDGYVPFSLPDITGTLSQASQSGFSFGSSSATGSPTTAFTTTESTAAACLIPTSAPVIGSIGTWSFDGYVPFSLPDITGTLSQVSQSGFSFGSSSATGSSPFVSSSSQTSGPGNSTSASAPLSTSHGSTQSGSAPSSSTPSGSLSSLSSLSFSSSLIPSTFSTVQSSKSIASISTSNIITTVFASSTVSTASPVVTRTRCSGNQVEDNCIAGTLPSLAPFSGPQPPSCDNGDGEPGTSPRINSTQASNAASSYCSQLINAGVILSASDTSVNALTVKGVAENNGDMVVDVLFDIAACPTDQSMSTLDFSSLGQDQCFSDLFTTLSEICEQDPGWADYNPDFTMEGGIFASDCALWSISANPST